jgi:alkanesulfonate monooxygenase SsuD/methylene tetrahydromethanopterin reductase-like flavin-dependent oxidoreductase (luciferase family)
MSDVGGSCEDAAMTTLGVVFCPQSPPEELRGVVDAVERSTATELWLWEDCFLEGGLTTAATALAWSERVHVGVGLLPVPLRNPAVTAMEIATLARLAPGRFVACLGHGVQEWMAQVGAAVESPMTLLREHVTAVRDLLAGRTVDVSGRYVALDKVALDWPPAEVPELLVGATGPRTIGLAGELADGVLLTASADADDVRRARRLVDDARADAGREGRARLVVYTELDPRSDQLPGQVEARTAELADAGADTVVLHGIDAAHHPARLIDALPR